MTRGDIVDLGNSLAKAVQAARRGDVDVLELELARLRTLPASNVGSIGTRLRAMARCAQAHPSFRTAPAAQAG